MATIRDVASLSGVSTATVSHVLNGRQDRIGPETRERVLRAVRTLRYRPPAKEVRQGAIATRNLAILVGDLSPRPFTSNGYFARVMDGVVIGAAAHGFSTTLHIERTWDDVGEAIRRSYDGRSDGVVLMMEARNNPIVDALIERGVPTVVIGHFERRPGLSCVDSENEESAADAVRRILARGHRRIAYLGGDRLTTSVQERAAGYRCAMVEARLGHEVRELYGSVKSTAESARVRARQADHPAPAVWADELVGRLLDEGREMPTALLVWNDDLARETIHALQAHGLRVPEDVSVVGFDDNHPAHGEAPLLTTVRQDLDRIGRRAAELAVAHVRDHSLPENLERFPTEFVERDTLADVNSHPSAPSRAPMHSKVGIP